MRAWVLIFALAALVPLRAETGHDAWLRYAPLDSSAKALYGRLPAAVFATSSSPVMDAARQELVRGVRGMLGRTLRVDLRLPGEDAVVLATFDSLPRLAPHIALPPDRVANSSPQSHPDQRP